MHVLKFLWSIMMITVFPTAICAHESPYALFGDTTKVLDIDHNVCKEWRMPVKFNDNTKGIIIISDNAIRVLDAIGKVLRSDSIDSDIWRARFTTIDPHSENYYPVSSYSYCGGEPVNSIDPDGQDIVVLNYDGGMHLGMLIQHDDAKWYYYSINGNNIYSSGRHSGGREFNDIGVGGWDSPQDFLNSEYNHREGDSSKGNKDYNHFGYKEGYRIKTTVEQDATIKDKFIKMSKTEYNLLDNNCATIVQEAMISAEVPVSKPMYTPSFIPVATPFGLVDVFNGYNMRCNVSIIPSVAYRSIIKWNKNGEFVRKIK